jgi:23S rRNA (guanosine2251-2'-O)-methyltransferase
MNEKESTIIFGRNPVRSAIGAKHVRTLIATRRLADDALVTLARANHIEVRLVDDKELDHLTNSAVHQGVAAIVKPYGTISLEELLRNTRKPYPLILILDGIEDPHNLGAILRSADAFGADGIILKSHGEVPLNGTVAKVSTGAIDYVKTAVVTNLSQAIEKLKAQGFWIVASDGSAKQNYDEVDYRCPIGLVVGSEGFGISPLLLKRSDFVVKIPMFGHVNSLNASVATGILLSEIALQRSQPR